MSTGFYYEECCFKVLRSSTGTKMYYIPRIVLDMFTLPPRSTTCSRLVPTKIIEECTVCSKTGTSVYMFRAPATNPA
eukprot:464584-Rhodomonas_salina.1